MERSFILEIVNDKGR